MHKENSAGLQLFCLGGEAKFFLRALICFWRHNFPGSQIFLGIFMARCALQSGWKLAAALLSAQRAKKCTRGLVNRGAKDISTRFCFETTPRRPAAAYYLRFGVPGEVVKPASSRIKVYKLCGGGGGIGSCRAVGWCCIHVDGSIMLAQLQNALCPQRKRCFRPGCTCSKHVLRITVKNNTSTLVVNFCTLHVEF